jgi:hypothetical protein
MDTIAKKHSQVCKSSAVAAEHRQGTEPILRGLGLHQQHEIMLGSMVMDASLQSVRANSLLSCTMLTRLRLHVISLHATRSLCSIAGVEFADQADLAEIRGTDPF